MKVSIVGVTGYSGLELVRLLRSHPEVHIQSIHSSSQTATDLTELYPHLKNICDLPLEPVCPEKIMRASDLVFFAAPAGIASVEALPFIEAGFPVIDLSGDFRLKEAGVYEQWYQKASAPLAIIEQAEYGLAEFRSNSKARLIANPGCYATAVLLALAPLAQAKLIQQNSIIVDAKSGLSGAGKKLSQTLHYTEAHDNMSLYKVNEHQHIPEVLQKLQEWDSGLTQLQFATSLIPVTRGILATVYARPASPVTAASLHELYRTTYADQPFVRVQSAGTLPALKQVIGSNYCDLGLTYHEPTQTIMVVAVIDNLVKGAAGQAVQNLNIMQGYPVEFGLEMSPIYP